LMSVLTAGALSLVSQLDTTAHLDSAAATGGTGPYTYQWYRSTTTGFAPGGGNILSGETALTLLDTGLSLDTTYYYKVVVTDAVLATATSTQLEVITPMATTAGALSKVSVGSTTASLSSAAASGGTAPYTYQWYRSTTTGFTPGGGNIITGATSLTLSDSGLKAGTNYFYKVIATDAGSVTGTSSQLSIVTTPAQPQPNQFQQSAILGMLQLPFNYNTLSVQFDPAASGTLVAGQAVVWSTANAGVVSSAPMVAPSTAQADHVAGFVNYNIKNASFAPGDRLEISMAGNVMYLQACAAITRGQFVVSCPAAVANGNIGGVTPVTGSSGFDILGYALDTVSAGSLVRIALAAPAAPYAVD
jgi:hypothetical protein